MQTTAAVPSIFTIASPIPGTEFTLLVHGLSGAVAIVLTEAWKQLELGHPEAIGDESRSLLLEDYILTMLSPDGEESLARQTAASLHMAAREEYVGGFLFIPTYLCNLRCPYCFQDHALHAGKGYTGRAVLTESQIDDAFSVIDRLRQKRKGITFDHVLFGGEPLQPPTIKSVSYLLEQAKRRGDRIKAISNGFEWESFADMLGPEGIYWAQVTLDGCKEIHDGRRFATGRAPTYDRIVRNIEMAIRKGAHIEVRVNLDTRNAESLGGLIEDLNSLKQSTSASGRLSVGIAVVHSPGDDSPFKITIADAVNMFGSLTGYYRNAVRTLRQLLDGESHPFRKANNCSAQLGSYLFDPLGDVYACYEQAGNRSKRIGTYSGGQLDLDDVKMGLWTGRHAGAIDECGRCKYILMCAGGCAHYAEQKDGTMYANHCEGMRDYMPRVLGAAYTELLDNKSSDNVLSLPVITRT